MCGIFGVISNKNIDKDNRFLKSVLSTLAKSSESRGKDSSGLCVLDSVEETFHIVKGAVPVTNLFRRSEVADKLKLLKNSNPKVAFGHARLVTNGTQLNEQNNQPIVKNNIIAIHNGIITNVDELWSQNPDLNRENEIDTEVLLALISKKIESGQSLNKSIVNSLESIEGTASIALAFNEYNKFILATNNGSLYILFTEGFVVFASEEQFLISLVSKVGIEKKVPNCKIIQLAPNSLFSINLSSFEFENINFSTVKNNSNFDIEKPSALKENIIHKVKSEIQKSAVIDINSFGIRSDSFKEREMLEYSFDKTKSLKRCTKCVLPETFPFISFDERGVCNYCNNYVPKTKNTSIDELKKMVEPFKRQNGSPDVLVPFSGGRDSTYSLHVIREELGLNPVTYTYDWGMVTDLARRNIARSCGKLGVENIIVAADIQKKRRNIRLNVEAWLKRPELGMIPLFMAGDKYFFYYANKICKEKNLDLTIWGSNYLENTDFKTGFCGIPPNFEKERIDALGMKGKLKLSGFFAKNYALNPSYINISLVNTFGAFLSRYAIKRTGYFQLFDYMAWNEDKVNELIIGEYNWELSKDSKNTWRIGDGTAAFYNYIYFLVAGFSEFDTFRSNQIREGMITREEAMTLIERENFPRYETIKWYLEIIGMNYTDVIKKVNAIKRLY